MRKRPFLFIGLASFLSALVCSLTSYTVGVVTALITALCLCGCSLVRRWHISPRIAALTGAAAVLIALLFAVRMIAVVEPQLALDGTTAVVTMRVEQRLSLANAYIVRVEDGTIPTGTRLCFWAGYRQIAPQNGDILTAETELVAAYDKRTESGSAAKANGVFLYAWPTTDTTLIWKDGQADVPFVRRSVYALREYIHDTLYRRMSFDGAAFSEGMMLGECGNLSMETSNAFRTSGVYHLLAVSGSHLVMITSAVFGVLGWFRCPRRLRAVLTMAAIVLFMALCGFTASVNRAGVSTMVMLSGQLFHRRADGLNSLGFASIAMLLVDPFCIYDIGWQLSFAATLGLLLFAPVWEREITARVVRGVAYAPTVMTSISTAVGVTFCASLATMPVSALHFGGMSTVFLPGNLVCVPLSEALLLGNFLSVLTAWFTPLSDMVFLACEWLARIMTVLAVRLAGVPFASVMVDAWVVIWLFGILVALVIGYQRRGMRGVWRAGVAMLAVFAIGCGIGTLYNRSLSRVTVAPCDETVVLVRTEDSRGLIVAADKNALKEAALLFQDEGVTALDWVLWLGEPSEHAAALSSLCVPIERLLVTASPDAFANLPAAREVTVFEEGGVLQFGTDGTLTRCGDVWRLCIGETDCLIIETSHADLSVLPDTWCDTDVLFLHALPDGLEHIRAEHTMMFCAHGDLETYRQMLPHVDFVIRGGVKSVQTRGDGNILLRE